MRADLAYGRTGGSFRGEVLPSSPGPRARAGVCQQVCGRSLIAEMVRRDPNGPGSQTDCLSDAEPQPSFVG